MRASATSRGSCGRVTSRFRITQRCDRWSVGHLDQFWGLLWDYFAVGGVRGRVVLGEASMSGAQWFPGSATNYVNHILRKANSSTVAIVDLNEDPQHARTVSWTELIDHVAALAASLRRLGVASQRSRCRGG
ncbi:hypothetical protein [Mycobacterium palustre]|uniref:hypothetical protein n=1 Tax=Mycobacterium palustre TaxID=153971 RepID=UPI001153817C|nr:hypothetical protein [Mycobacterium palustre]MCV7104115.1 hypothetical protein [Mycobacterium palustre]